VRDFDFWLVEAQKKLLDDRIERIQNPRIAQATGEDYQKIVNGLEQKRWALEGEEGVAADAERTKRAWESLKAIGRG
jgi:hypothetical protein